MVNTENNGAAGLVSVMGVKRLIVVIGIVCGTLICIDAVIFFTDSSGDSVTTRFNHFLLLLIGGICISVATLMYAAPPLKNRSGETMTRRAQSFSALFIGIFGIVFLIANFTFSTTVDGNGITQKNFFTGSTFVPWIAVTEVDYKVSYHRGSDNKHFIIRHSNSGRIRIDVNLGFLSFTNSKEALEIVAKNVPNDRFTDKARWNLAEMGIRTGMAGRCQSVYTNFCL